MGQYSVISQDCITYSARATQETNILVLSIDVINKVKVDNKQMLSNIKETLEKLKTNKPRLDYKILRNKPTISALLEPSNYNPVRVFNHCF